MVSVLVFYLGGQGSIPRQVEVFINLKRFKLNLQPILKFYLQ